MIDFAVGDVVKITMPQAENKRGVMGVHVMYTTSQEAKCDGTVGTIVDIKPDGTHRIPLYLVDFTTHENKTSAPYTAYWFRTEWLRRVDDPEARRVAPKEPVFPDQVTPPDQPSAAR